MNTLYGYFPYANKGHKKTRVVNKKTFLLYSDLNRLSPPVLSPSKRQGLISQTLKDIRNVFNATFCWISIYVDESFLLKSAGSNLKHQRLITSKLLCKLSPRLLRKTYPLIYNRSSESTKINEIIFRFLSEQNISRFMGVPLIQANQLIGSLNVVREKDSPDFTSHDLNYLILLGNQIVMSIESPSIGGPVKSLKFLEAIIDHIPNPVFIKDRKHLWIILNPAITNLLGYPRERMLGKSDYDFFSKEQADFFWKKDEEMFRTGKVIDIPEEPITDHKGNIHYIHTKKAPLRDSSGRITHLVGIIEDITELKHTERELIKKEKIARERALLLNDLRTLYQKDQVLNRACKAIRDSELFERAVMTLHDGTRQITHLGQVGLPRKMIELARKAPPLDRKQIKRITSKRFRISDSFFIPVEAGVDFSKNGRYIPQKKGTPHADWQAGDELFIPLRDFTGKIMGYLSVDTPKDGCRPDLMNIQSVEMLVEAAASRIRELDVQKAHRDSEENYRLLVENIKEGIYSIRKGIFTSVNNSICRMFGYSKKELIGMPAWNLAVPEKRESIRKVFFEKATKKDFSPVEVECIRKNGSVFIAEIRLSRIPIKNQFLGIVSDITDRKRTEEELAVLKRHLEFILGATKTGVDIIDSNFNILYIDPEWQKVYGDPKGKKCYKYFMGRNNVCPTCGIPEVLKTKRPKVTEELLVKESNRPIQVTTIPFQNEKGEWLVAEVNADISERKQAEIKLRESEEKYRLLVEHANEAIVVAQEGHMKFVNPKMIEILGYSEKELLSKPFTKFIHPADRKMVVERHLKRIKGEEVPSLYDFRVINRKGDVKWLEINAVTITWGNKPATLNFLTDITKRKQDEWLKEQYHEQKMLFGLTQALSSATDLEHLLKIAAKKVTEITGTERCSIALVDPEGSSATLKTIHAPGKIIKPSLLNYRFTPNVYPQIMGMVVHNKPYLMNDVDSLPVRSPESKYFRSRGIKSAMAIPLVSRGKTLGFITSSSMAKLHTYTPEEIRLLQTIASPIAISIENYQLLENLKTQALDLKKQTHEKDILLEISQALSQTMDVDKVAIVASQVAGKSLGVDRCSVILLTEEGNHVEVRGIFSQYGGEVKYLLGKQYPVNIEPLWKNIIAKRKVLVINDIAASSFKGIIKEHHLKEGLKSLLVIGMFFGNKLVGVLALSSIRKLRFFSRDEIKLAQTIANQIAVAIENARLMQVVKVHTHELKELSSELMQAQEGERKRIAQELHDQVGQMLQSMKMNLDRIKRNLSNEPQRMEDTKDWLLDTEKLLSQTIDDIRTLTFNLRPSMLDDFGLFSTLRWYTEDYSRRSNVKVTLKGKEDKYRFPLEIEVNLYRIIQEALTNVIKHAVATEVTIFLYHKNSCAILSVKDNGRGFDNIKLSGSPHKGTGIYNMKERVNLLGGSFEIISKPGKGTRINVRIPFTEVKYEEGQIIDR